MKFMFYVTLLSVCLLQGIYGIELRLLDDTINIDDIDDGIVPEEVPNIGQNIAELLENTLGPVFGFNLGALLNDDDFSLTDDPEKDECYVGTMADVLEELVDRLGITYNACISDGDCTSGYSCEKITSAGEGPGFCYKEPAPIS